ncbi:SpoIIE family protein phosphatase [Desulfatirhabdium butyrativorans]|uniref:SpoIIE family protein phosphatase n=1 Tax=Desulfatirhabdium butyrativorans TaxID=340467 RepID=UPI000412AB75|nr:SpoIIE family protein phosphatase [Desulfatirhabdium butyrativorans]
MRFRTQLLLLLLGLSVLPMVAVRTYGIHNVRAMGDALLKQVALVEQESCPSDIPSTPELLPDGDRRGRLDRLRSDIQRRIGRIEHLTAFFLTTLTLLAAACSFWFSRRIIGILEPLVEKARRIAAGVFDTDVPVNRKDEFGEIARGLNSIGPRLKDHYRMRQALAVTTEVQRRLLPLKPPAVPGVDIDAMTLYSDETGGDYYDYLCTGSAEKICVTVGDVAGHGLPAALLMANVRGMLRLRAAIPGTLEELLLDVNRQYARDMEVSCQFMTLFLLRIDRQHGRIEWVRAGHNPGLLYDPDAGTFHELSGEGSPLGLWEDVRFPQSAVSIKPGQIVVLFSDGIVETRNPEGKYFGKDRLKEVVRKFADISAKMLVLSILDAVTEFRAEGEQEDDMTVMAIKIAALPPGKDTQETRMPSKAIAGR